MVTKEVHPEDGAHPITPSFKPLGTFKTENDRPSASTSSEVPKVDNILVEAKLTKGEVPILLTQETEDNLSYILKAIDSTGHVIILQPKEDDVAYAYATRPFENRRFVESHPYLRVIDLSDDSGDVALGNRVTSFVSPTAIQLAIDEVYRVLKPGGRIALSDLLLRRELDERIKGALPSRESGLRNGVLVNQFESALRVAGFEDISIIDKKSDVHKILSDGVPEAEPESQHGRDGDKGGLDHRKAGRFTRSLAIHDEPEEKAGPEIDWNEWIGFFHVFAKKPKA